MSHSKKPKDTGAGPTVSELPGVGKIVREGTSPTSTSEDTPSDDWKKVEESDLAWMKNKVRV